MKLPRILLALALIPSLAAAQDTKPADRKAADKKPAAVEEKKSAWSADTWSGLELRSIGPALTSGRISDLAVDPTKPSRWYVAVASGGVWKTENAGATWAPLFDKEGSFSIGCITIDPQNPYVVWVGTGENNGQRSVAYGDGVYRSEDGGKSWTNMGLKASEHIGKILVHPKDSNTVFVAAQGPLWSAGGDRGLYKTTDGGKSWKAVLKISENTGVTDVVMDPRNPDVMLAASHQRRRHVFTMISGGPESALYKSTDGGESWRKLKTGLPKDDIGRVGLAISPADPDVVYAIMEAPGKSGGFYRSADRGETWKKQGDYQTSGNYYSEILADPVERDRVYSMDVFLQVTNDAGKTFGNLGEKSKHVDNHAMWIDPKDNDHYLVGCDGGLYESHDRGANWKFFGNLPVTQFYRVSADESFPVYDVYGGTQDNYSLAGPSRTLNVHGIANQDWYVTWGGDGFHSLVDPREPDIVYATLQYGVLSRFDRKTGESLLIQPQEGKGEEALRWNWDSPLVVSPHKLGRIYFAANRVFRSDDRGASWTPVSGDLTRRTDRNQLKVMGKIWGPDAVARGASTSPYGNIVSLAESPLQEGLLYAGTDDGLVQVSEDGGANWRRVESFPGVPAQTYVSELYASTHDANVVYAGFNNHKNGDFKPYLLRSGDRGRSWTGIAGDLPANGSVWTLVEDAKDEDLVFCGTEFGLFFSKDGGRKWVRLKGGMPTIAVRDLHFQKSQGDLVVGSFGRGIYILDDTTPLRVAKPADLEQGDLTFPVRKTWGFIPSSPLGQRDKSFQGEAYYTALNPPFGAVFSYYLKDELKTLEKKRQEAEKAADKKGESLPFPSLDALKAEADEEEPALIMTVSDSDGNVVRRLTGPSTAGVHRVAWDLRLPPANPTPTKPFPTDNPFFDPPQGPLVVPGAYTVAFSKRIGGVETPFGSPQAFEVAALQNSTLPAADRPALVAFQLKTARLQRAVLGAAALASQAAEHLGLVKKALEDAPGAAPRLRDDARALEARLREIQTKLRGDSLRRRLQEPTPPGISERVGFIVNAHWTSTSPASGTAMQSYAIAAEEFEATLAELQKLVDVDMKALDAALEAAGAPWTPGRVPVWKKE
ncbi:MAG: glycosyl hydrolase [Vicinamibacteria bacterium]